MPLCHQTLCAQEDDFCAQMRDHNLLGSKPDNLIIGPRRFDPEPVVSPSLQYVVLNQFVFDQKMTACPALFVIVAAMVLGSFTG